ncbi:hypothetical protein [Runella sp.]|uniref:hypothetical protein n=1 Tax=Runella sp. TaxID=1960881 RepID=UPI003D114B16
MKKTYIKSFLTVIITFFISMSCDRQLESAPQLTADKLLKDKDFLSFLSSTEEVRYKVIYRQRDLRTFERVDSSLKKIQTWGKDPKLTLKNKALIVNELGFESWSAYEKLENDIQKKRALIISKYPELLSLPSEERMDLLLKTIERWDNSSQIRRNVSDLCPNCFFNNCDYCSDGQFKEPNPGENAATGYNQAKLEECKQIKLGIKNASLNIAWVVYLESLIGCGAVGVEAGSWAAGLTGPLAGHAFVVVGGLAGSGCALGATLIYFQTKNLIELTYRDGVMDCEDKYGR